MSIITGVKEKAPRSAKEGLVRKHYCIEHNIVCKPTMIMPGRKIIYNCSEGCSLNKSQTNLRTDILPQTSKIKRKKS